MNKCLLFLLLSFGGLLSNNKQLIDSLYKNIDGYAIPESEERDIVSHGGDPTYGEITYEGCRKLASILHLGSHDHFYDLGSGTGACVTTMYLDTSVKKSVGIEYAQSRHDAAMRVKNRLRKKGRMRTGRTLQFIRGDISQVNFNDATAILFNSLCYSDDFMRRMVDRFVTLKNGTRIASTLELPQRKYLIYNGHQLIQMSWDPEVAVYFYTVKHPTIIKKSAHNH